MVAMLWRGRADTCCGGVEGVAQTGAFEDTLTFGGDQLRLVTDMSINPVNVLEVGHDHGGGAGVGDCATYCGPRSFTARFDLDNLADRVAEPLAEVAHVALVRDRVGREVRPEKADRKLFRCFRFVFHGAFPFVTSPVGPLLDSDDWTMPLLHQVA
ncbi:hypothetical protein [Nocardia wallacei]|uniref:hypothetical protein n=1 Tax=Nocardia wallacei TaxID=480035 RepID=UPI002454D2B3|nr:hypothetical protein [Nocardia wallacei]